MNKEQQKKAKSRFVMKSFTYDKEFEKAREQVRRNLNKLKDKGNDRS